MSDFLKFLYLAIKGYHYARRDGGIYTHVRTAFSVPICMVVVAVGARDATKLQEAMSLLGRFALVVKNSPKT